MSFYEELKRRNVGKEVLLYLITAWLIAQVADFGHSLPGLPDLVV